MELWEHQRRGLAELWELMTPGNAICFTSPTGGGKTVCMTQILKHVGRSILYTNRRMLLDQTAKVLEREGISFGYRAAGHAPEFHRPIQLSSIQTEASRVIKRDSWPLHDAEVVLIDEAHANKEGVMCELIRRHREAGAIIVGVTATPLDIGHIYDHLVVAGKTRELIDAGVLLPAKQYGPDEPDLRHVKRTKTGEYKQAEIVKAIMTHSIFGRVIDHWRRLNPEEKATIGFAPGVKESLWFAEKCCAEGINAAHIDGDNVWIDGTLYKSDEAARDELKLRSAEGDIKIVWNRFVMREGIDWPHLYHGIFATIFGSLVSFLQSGGRLLRADRNQPDMKYVIIQDHGGNWHRHGSLNSDRQWELGASDYAVCGVREERMREKKEREPICCPKCFALRLSGPDCIQCGHRSDMRSRMVVQADGSLKEMKGDIYRPRRTYRQGDVEDKWKKYYFRCKKAGMTFNQASALFAMENNWQHPPRNISLMPIAELDWFRTVGDVPMSRLIQENAEAFS